MAKDKILEKIMKKSYSNELEEILSKKRFSEEVKNLLLDIIYKIDISYNDYETVKKNTLSKEEYMKNIVNTVKKNCEKIRLLQLNENAKLVYNVDKEKKTIECFPIERNILYCLAKIKKNDDIIKEEPEFLNKSLTNMLNIGNNINTVEPLRDFNGFSWNIGVSEIEDCYYNLVYQNLILIVGNKFLEDWTNKYDNVIDYLDLFKEELEKNSNKKIAKNIMEYLKSISVLLEVNRNKEYKNDLIDKQKEIKQELEKMKDKVKYLDDLSKIKKDLLAKIKHIELIISDKDKLAQEYEKRNRRLPLEEKIFSKRVLKLSLMSEKEGYLNELKKCNDKMNSKNFLKNEKELKYQNKYLKYADSKELKKEIIENIILIQEQIFEVLNLKIKNAKTKEDLIKIMYELRYINLLPINKSKTIGEISNFKKTLKELETLIIQKLYDLKIVNQITNNPKVNIEILKNIFDLKIIKLEDIYIKLVKENDEYFAQFYDDKIEDERIKIKIGKDEKIRLNRKIKLFI